MQSRPRDANAPELCHAIPKKELQSIKPESLPASVRSASAVSCQKIKQIKGKRNAAAQLQLRAS
jgi:hypothetical protein